MLDKTTGLKTLHGSAPGKQNSSDELLEASCTGAVTNKKVGHALKVHTLRTSE